MNALVQLSSLVDRFQPGLVSQHLCWGAIGGRHLNDLLPLPYTDEALDAVCADVAQIVSVQKQSLNESMPRAWSGS